MSPLTAGPVSTHDSDAPMAEMLLLLRMTLLALRGSGGTSLMFVSV